MSEDSHNARGAIFALLGGIGWGFSGACGQFLFASYNVDPLWLSSVRMIFAGLLVLVLCICIPRCRVSMCRLWRNPKDVIRLIVFALFGLATCQISYLLAIKYSNAATATVLQYIGPVLIVIFVCLRCMRLPRIKEVAAVLCVVTGTFLLATHGNPSTMVLSEQGLVWGLLAAVAVALYTLLPMGLMQKYGSIPVTGLALIIGGILFTVSSQPWNRMVPLDAAGYTAVVAMITFGTAFGFVLYLQGVADIGASKASLIASVETVSATFFAVVWLGTAFSWIDIVGFCFIMATVFLLSNMSYKPKIRIKKTKTLFKP